MKNNNIFKQIVEEKAWCKTHPTSPVGRHPVTHEWPVFCLKGFRSFKATSTDPRCKIIVENQKESEVIK
jgi:hypothetical protein